MGFLTKALGESNNTVVSTSPYQGQNNLASQAAGTATAQQGISQAQQDFMNALTTNANSAATGTNALTGQLQNQALGNGPNPALNQLNQATAQNQAATAAQIANSKGINPGLATRLAAQNGAATQQQAAGQAATLRAQQQLGAQGALGNLYGNQVNQAQQQQNLTGQQNLTQQQIFQNALNNQNSQYLQGKGIESGIAQQNAAANSALIGGLTGGLSNGTVAGNIGGGGGGSGGDSGGKSGGLGGLFSFLAEGGKVPTVNAMLSPGEMYLDPNKAKEVADGKAHPLSGKMIPGKAKVEGNSLVNDTVHAKLKPGGIVVPRDKMNSNDPAKNAKDFVQAILNSKGSFGKVVAAKRKMKE